MAHRERRGRVEAMSEQHAGAINEGLSRVPSTISTWDSFKAGDELARRYKSGLTIKRSGLTMAGGCPV